VKTAGVIILIVGLLITLSTAFTYFTKEENMDSNESMIGKDNQHKNNWQPFLGIGIMVIGSVVYILGWNQSDERKIFEK
jgi:hypothetical protein